MRESCSYLHCDVFSPTPFGGNSLAVFTDANGLNAGQMLRLTQELRHFESIFLEVEGDSVRARIFDLFGELPFAGHPMLGAAAMLHRASGDAENQCTTFRLGQNRSVVIDTERRGQAFIARMDQGQPEFIASASDDDRQEIAAAFRLDSADLAPLPIETVSTGLAYLIVPLRSGLDRARPARADLEAMLGRWSASFVYLLDTDRLEGRTWNNDGVIEDIATGSAAGPVAAYGLKHKFVAADTPTTLRQGRFVGRPSEIIVTAFGSSAHIERVEVAGAVAFVGSGNILTPPQLS